MMGWWEGMNETTTHTMQEFLHARPVDISHNCRSMKLVLKMVATKTHTL